MSPFWRDAWKKGGIIAAAALGTFILLGLLVGCTEERDPYGAGSDVRVLVDAATGCQYLAPRSSPNGGLTPRRDAIGQHMGCRVEIARP